MAAGAGPGRGHRVPVRAVTRFGAFLDSAGAAGPDAVSREVLERYLASLAALSATRRYHDISRTSTFLRSVRLHGWEERLPAGAMIFREDYPRKPALLPRALAEHVMAQVEDPSSLGRCADPAAGWNTATSATSTASSSISPPTSGGTPSGQD